MTIEDAITILTLYRAKIVNSVSIGIEEDVKAYDLAIKALKQTSVLDQIKWERDIAISQLKDLGYGFGEKPRTDGDLISRDKALELVNYALAENKDVLEVLENMPNAEKTDTDLISRSDLLNKIWQKEYGTDYDGVNLLNIPHIDIIEQMPSAEKTAEWISVRKQKPEDYEEVIATVRYDYGNKQEYEVVTGVRYSKEDGWEWAYEAGADYWESINGVVVAWQPLPKPYEVKR